MYNLINIKQLITLTLILICIIKYIENIIDQLLLKNNLLIYINTTVLLGIY